MLCQGPKWKAWLRKIKFLQPILQTLENYLAFAADYVQYKLEQVGFFITTIIGKVIGAVGNFAAGVLSGGLNGGYIGFGIWLSGKFASDGAIECIDFLEKYLSYLDYVEYVRYVT